MAVVTAVAMGSAAAQEYRCHSHGKRYEQGEITCIRGKTARCDMYLNNSSWEVVADMCPRVRPPEPRRDSDVPSDTED